jgi:hypothetical protein
MIALIKKIGQISSATALGSIEIHVIGRLLQCGRRRESTTLFSLEEANASINQSAD